MTHSIASDTRLAPDPTAPVPQDNVVLVLAERTVAFTGTQVGSFYPPGWAGPDDHNWLVTYVTPLESVVVYDPTPRTLTVYTVADFIATYANSPVGWIIDDVLTALQRPIEQLDI